MKRKDFYEQEKLKKTIYMFSITLVLSIVIFLTIFVMYNKKLKSESIKNLESLGKIEEIVSNEELEETSISSDVTVKDKENQNVILNNKTENTKKVNKDPVESTVKNTTNNIKVNTSNENVNEQMKNSIVENTLEEVSNIEEKELIFMAPVSGEIIKDFANENLIYSKTLEEWTTHTGIDIKADKTSIVTASEEGNIESIKNDPRYGLTITISHRNGFKTIYSNLLSTEFVKENEFVEKGQTIGTVGDSASFEVADESHLHFEMYKDGNIVNPTIYLK